MRNLLILPVLLLTLLVGTPAFSADFIKGHIAYESGDYATALREWEPLAEQGVADAQTNLGVRYNSGYGVPQDYKTAVGWYRLAAEQGNASAQSNLGLMYAKGHGVIQDYVRAHMWLNIAASSGYKSALESRDIVAGRVTPSQLEKAQELARECVAKNYKGC
jgi:uncharacterized protein